MEHQFRQGIYRPNAQRLSLSLKPMVAQRSLMFRVKTDLATKTSYAELTPTDESPLYSSLLSGNVVLPAISVVLSAAMSSASMYSQDSWKSASPSVPVFEVDTRRMTIATSPTVQWSDIAEEKDSDIGFTLKPPSVHSVPTSPQDVSFSMVKENDDIVSHCKSAVVPSLTNNVVHESIRSLVDVGSLRSLGKRLTKIKPQSKKIDQHSPKHSRSSKAFRKVMNRLSFLPSKRELAQLRRTDSV